MITVLDLARTYTSLQRDDLEHLESLVFSWQPLADLCFADLMLFAPLKEHSARFVALSQVRPVTGQTLYPHETSGAIVDEEERPLVAEAFHSGESVEGDGQVVGTDEPARLLCIPVRHDDRVIGVLTRYQSTVARRRRGELERNYLKAFGHFAEMVQAGSFPFPLGELNVEEEPRVGDGVIIVEDDLTIRFASPNAVSSMHRMGFLGYSRGAPLTELGFDVGAVEMAMSARTPVLEEVEEGDSNTMMRVVPFLEGDTAVGAILLIRDVTDLRRRDRMLLSKDATIREIHHRVKNNLQTIAALLRLQSRRLRTPEAQQAVAESERRIRSIALVHETLAKESSEVVPFDDIVRPLARVVEEGVSSPETPISFTVKGSVGDLPGSVATPLAVVLNELMQNALDHAFDYERPGAGGTVTILLERDGDDLSIDVVDDGRGLPGDFELENSKGLGLSIVQALVTSELGGTIELVSDGGTHVRVRLSVPHTPDALVAG
ncbi:MAG: sensor histidine kinase [Acidimicrobiia bacterium]